MASVDRRPDLELDGIGTEPGASERRVVNDWLTAISLDRQPVCGGYAGMKALEMAMAVFAAGLARGRVDFPLKNRQHPLRAGSG